MPWASHQLFLPAVPGSGSLFVFLLQLRPSAFLWIYKSYGLSFIAHQREITRTNPFVPTVIKAWEGEMVSSISLQIKLVWENAVCERLWIKGECWDNVGSERDARTVCFILLASQQQEICRRKLLSTTIHVDFYTEHLSLSGKGSSDNCLGSWVAKRSWPCKLHIR